MNRGNYERIRSTTHKAGMTVGNIIFPHYLIVSTRPFLVYLVGIKKMYMIDNACVVGFNNEITFIEMLRNALFIYLLCHPHNIYLCNL